VNEPDLRDIVRRVARQHLGTSHPERLEELDAVFDVAYAKAVERVPRVDGSGQRHGLAFDTSLLDPSVVAFTVAVALQFVQIARLSRKVEHLKELVDGAKGFTKVQKSELLQIAELVTREAVTWAPARQAEPLPVEALQLLVLRRERHGRPVLEFRLHGHLQADGGERSYERRSFGEVALGKEPAELIGHLFARMVKGDLETERERVSAVEWVRQRGAFLFETLLPKSLQKELRALAATGGPLLVISEEQWIPWELLTLAAADDGGESSFLAEAFTLARWLPGTTPAARLPLRRVALVCSEKADAVQQGGQEASVLASLAARAGRRAEPVAADSLALTEAMARGVHDAWHFIGHGGRSRAGAEWDELALDHGVFNPQDLSSGVAAGLANARPFVFLNACHVGGVAQGLIGAGGWPARFLEVGAGAFLGPLWAIPSDQAAVFAPAVYERLLAGEPIGEAVRQARLMLRNRFPGHPTWLAYSLYADPRAVSPPTEG